MNIDVDQEQQFGKGQLEHSAKLHLSCSIKKSQTGLEHHKEE